MDQLLKYISSRVPLHLKAITYLAALMICPMTMATEISLEKQSISELEQLRTDIDSELEQLASFTLRGGTGSLGYRSKQHLQPDSTEWIRIELGKEVDVDQVVLVPVLFRDSKTGLRAEGFPVVFRILAGTAHTTNVVASFSAEDHLLPRIAPMAIPFQSVKASWVEIEATTLPPSINITRYALQLSEMLVFSGMENVALQQPVTVPAPSKNRNNSRHERFLTDGFSPYLMDAAQGSPSKSTLIRTKAPHPSPTLTIDLKTSHPVNQINLHTANVALSIPMVNFSSWAVPRHVRITGANRSDFADETILSEYNQKTIYDTGPMIMLRFPETMCRYIRLEIIDHQPVVSLRENPSGIAFSEIEVLSKSQNVALGTTVTASSNLSCSKGTLLQITNGRNYYGEIIPVRDWMNQLSRHHDLEYARPLVVAELNRRYEHQKTSLRRMIWLAALLVGGIGFTILINRVLRMRHEIRIRERFAADLHDELGANIHTIGLLGDVALDSITTPERLKEILQRNRELTQRTGSALRHCIGLQEASDLFGNLPDDMHKAARRILADLEYEITLDGEDILAKLKPLTRTDLFLFFKESLVNINRHANATHVGIRLIATKKEFLLTISDNGYGHLEAIPPSLKRRAHLLRAQATVANSESGGTKITLQLHLRRWKNINRKSS